MECTLILKSLDGNWKRIRWASLPPVMVEPAPPTVRELNMLDSGSLAEYFESQKTRQRHRRLVDKINTGKRWVGYYELMPEGN